MRVLLDTNILISALLVESGTPGSIYSAWRNGAFFLLSSQQQIAELRSTFSKPAIAARIRPHHAGRMINDLKARAIMIDSLPRVTRSSDPDDDFLLAIAEGGQADYLVTGDKSGLLELCSHERTLIVTAAKFASKFV